MRNYSQWLERSLESAGLGAWDWNLVDGSVYRSPQHDRVFGLEISQSAEWSFAAFLECLLPEEREPIELAVENLKNTAKTFTSNFEFALRMEFVGWPAPDG